MEKQTHFDFITSIFLAVLSLVMIADCYRIWKDVGGEIYASPGMLPMLLAIVLLLTSIQLFRRSVQVRGVAQNWQDFRTWFTRFVKSKMAHEMALGAAILALYTFALAPRLPFWLSTSIFMVVLMHILKASSLVRILIITALVVSSLYGIFQMIFHVPLP